MNAKSARWKMPEDRAEIAALGRMSGHLWLTEGGPSLYGQKGPLVSFPESVHLTPGSRLSETNTGVLPQTGQRRATARILPTSAQLVHMKGRTGGTQEGEIHFRVVLERILHPFRPEHTGRKAQRDLLPTLLCACNVGVSSTCGENEWRHGDCEHGEDCLGVVAARTG